MKNRCSILLLFALLLTGSVAGAPVQAQQQAPILFQFRISNPGARSLGFGGAFAALADDASAAFANPAGLVQLLRPEISAEIRVTGFSTPETSGSSLDFSGVGFASFVYPLKRFSFAAYRADLVNIAVGTNAVENVGLAAAYRVSESFSLGLAISQFSGDFAAAAGIVPMDPQSSEEPGFLVASTSDGTDLSFNAGFLWHLPRRFSVAGFFRQGASFGLSTDLVTPGAIASDPRVPFDLADVFGLGVAYRSQNGVFTASFEWDRLQSASALEDGDELHLGVELALIRTSPVVALRLGAWQDSDRTLRSAGDGPVVRPLLPVGTGETHLAAGLGVAFKRLKLDAGFEHSDLVDTGSISIVFSF